MNQTNSSSQPLSLQRFSQSNCFKTKYSSKDQMLNTFSVFNPDRGHAQYIKIDIGRIPQYQKFKESFTQDNQLQFNEIHHQEISSNPRRFCKNKGPISKYIDNSKSLITLLGFKGLRPPFSTKLSFNLNSPLSKQNSFNFEKSQQMIFRKRKYTKSFENHKIYRPLYPAVQKNAIRDQRNNFAKSITDFNENRYVGKICKQRKTRMYDQFLRTANLSKSGSSKYSKNSIDDGIQESKSQNLR